MSSDLKSLDEGITNLTVRLLPKAGSVTTPLVALGARSTGPPPPVEPASADPSSACQIEPGIGPQILVVVAYD